MCLISAKTDGKNCDMEISLKMQRILWRPGDPIMPLFRLGDLTRFSAAFETRGVDECWPWMRSADRHGYGMFKLGGSVRMGAHRIAYTLAHGEPGKSHVCHRCDNPRCVNPTHLFTGSAKANAEDKVQKGRARGRFSAKGSIRDTDPCPNGADL